MPELLVGNRAWLCQHCQEIGTALVTGAEPVLVSLLLWEPGQEHWALLGARAGQSCPESQGGGQGLVPTAGTPARGGEEEKGEATLVCDAAARQDHPQHLHTAWNHPQSPAGFVLMGSRAPKGP